MEGKDDTPVEKAEAKPLSPAAQRALKEAESRRAEYDKVQTALPREINGRAGTEPVRYGDWEVKGLTSDF
jgi:hypothetical protein